jgi:hypothetical protein
MKRNNLAPRQNINIYEGAVQIKKWAAILQIAAIFEDILRFTQTGRKLI